VEVAPNMGRYLIRRTLWAAVLFVVVTAVTYIIFFLIPVDPARQACGQRPSQQCIENARETLGLDRPVAVQYGLFVWKIVRHGDLGFSYVNRQRVTEIVLDAAPVTASVVFGGILVEMMIAFPLGVLSGRRPRTKLDRAGMTFAVAGVSLPSFWVGLILAYVVGYRLGWTPITGYCDFIDPSTDCGGPVQWAYHLLLPWLTYGLLGAAIYVRIIRANVLEILTEDYVRTARAKGAGERRVMKSHVLRNAMLPFVTILGLEFGIALGGAIFLEQVFSLPGLGQTALQSVTQFDLPVTMGIVVFGTTTIILFNLIVDLLYAWIDPRIRLA
jgi:peptide/nickel transport system permease protein